MSSKYLILFVVSFLTTASKGQVDLSTLQDVFGSPDSYSASQNQQEVLVAPPNKTLNDPDYWDFDDFRPSPLEYDHFDWTLTKRVAAFSEENFLLSPLGLKLCLAILAEGATAGTQAELSAVLGFDSDRNNTRKKFSTILNSLQTKSSQYILNLGSRIYIANYAEPRQRFAAIAEQFYRTELKRADFSKPPLAVKEINSWVANLTDGHIPALVDEGDVIGTAILVLNTLYFKGSWRHQFPPNETVIAPFFVKPNLPKNVYFMNVKDKFFFAESAKYDAKIIRMPYLGNKFSMYLVVPNSLTGLSRVFGALNELRSEMYYMQERLVQITLPKFEFDYTSHLDGVLKELGIRQAFEDTASFPGIGRGQSLPQRLKISKVLQRSGIEVNEVGSIAYSATEISLVNKFGEDGEPPQEVLANKPFLFYIEDEGTRQLLFTGRVADPSHPDGAFKLS